MIIFGTRSKNIGSEQAEVTCGHCESNNSIWVYIYRSYFHIFWIPAFPLWKSSASQCSHCKQVLEEYQYNPELVKADKLARKNAKTPWWMWFWLLALLVLAIAISLTSIFTKM